MRDFWHERLALEKEKRELIKKLMEPYAKYFADKGIEIREACSASTQGHSFRFTDTGPLGHAWYHCTKCGASRVEGFDE